MSSDKPVFENLTETAPAPVDASTLVSPLAATMPDVTAEKAKAESPSTTPTDSTGRPFDRELHAVHEDGTPKTDKHGRFYFRSVGRPKKTESGSGGGVGGNGIAKPSRIVNRPPPKFANVGQPKTPVSNPELTGDVSPVSAAPAVNPDARFEIMAESYLRLSYAPLVAVLGTDAQPDADEHNALKIATVPVLKHYEADDLHPLVGLCAVVIGVGLAKAQKPTVRERFAAFLARFRKK